MKKRVNRLMILSLVLFAIGLGIPALTFRLSGLNGSAAKAQGVGLSNSNIVLKDKYSDKVKETEQKRNEAKAKKDKVENEIAQLKREAEDILEYLTVMDQKQSETMLELEAAQAELDRITIEYDQAVIDLENAEIALAKQYESMKKRIQYIYENGSVDKLEMILESNSLLDILNASEYIDRINQYDRKLLVNYAANRVAVEDRKKILGLQKEEMELATDMYEQDAKYCEQIISAKKEAMARYEEKIGASEELLEDYIVDFATAQKTYEQAVAEQKEYIRQQEEIKRKQQEEERRKQQEAAAAAAANQKPVTSYDNAKDVPLTGETNINKMVWPLPGDYRVGSKFGPRVPPCAGASSFHQGWDIGGKQGAQIVAVLAGKVTAAGYNNSCGNHVYIDHGNGYSTHYLHLSAIKTSVGARVQQGQVIGLCGSTGISTAPHLHFALYKNGTAIDPAPYLHY